MIVNEQHRKDLIIIAKKMAKGRKSIPLDENGPLDDSGNPLQPTETFLEYLSLMYDPEIAKTVKYLPVYPAKIHIAKFAKEAGINKSQLVEKLADHKKKLFVMAMGGRHYSLPDPFFVYDGPFLAKANYEGPDAKEFADLSRKFFIHDKYYKKWETSSSGIPYLRVLTVSETIEPGHEIMPPEEINNVIDRNNFFAVIPCPCRLRAGISGVRECTDKYPLENCIILGGAARFLAEEGSAKEISKEEVRKILKHSAEVGLVLTTDNNAEFSKLICSCCECCCGMLRGLTRFDNPRAIAKANFISTIDEELCVACGTCIDRCKFGAISVNDVAQVNPDKCVGCGLCAVTCPSNAIIMKRFEREEIPEEYLKI
jgi:ferredoxin